MLLHQFQSCPYCIKVRNKLEELGLDYETREVPRDRSQRNKIKELSGQLKVPVLEDGEQVIHDSTAIVRYLEENYGE
ncbi:MAG: glutathione S-transferase family protein [Bacillota bacterium]